MLPIIPILLGVGAIGWGAKKIYDAVQDDSSGSSSDSDSSSYSDNSYEREEEVRYAEMQRRQAEREDRQFSQLQQTLFTEIRNLCQEQLIEPQRVSLPSRARIESFYEQDLNEPADAKAALSELLGTPVVLKDESVKQQAAYQAQIKALEELKQLVKAL